MADVKTFVVSVIALLVVFLQTGIKSQPTIGSFSKDDFCSQQLKEECDVQTGEYIRLRRVLENKEEKMATMEVMTSTQAEENRRLWLEIDNMQQLIATLRNESNVQMKETRRLNLELDNNQHLIATLRNVSSVRTNENRQLNTELEKRQQRIETLERLSNYQVGVNCQLTNDLENKQKRLETLENVSNAQVAETRRLNIELETKQQMIETLKNDSYSHSEENKRLRQENRRLRLKTQPVTATLIRSFDLSRNRYGITKVEDKIYIIDNHKIQKHPNVIQVYEDRLGFRFTRNITISDTNWPNDIVYSNESKCVYISDYHEKCIWVMTTTGVHRLTKWLHNVTAPNTLSLTKEGHLLVLRQSQSISQDSLEIYSLNATLIRKLSLPQDIKDSRHVVHTLTGNFIVIHRLNNATHGTFVISMLTTDGMLIHRFIPRNQSETLNNDEHYLSLDPDNSRLFVADYDNQRVILFDSNVLTWSQVLVSNAVNGIRDPFRLFYDANKKHLFVAQYGASIIEYDIN